MIKGVHHVAISTASLERLCRFYCDVLGFDPVFEADWESGSEMGKLCDRIIGIDNTASKVAMVSKNGVIIELFEYSPPRQSRSPLDGVPAIMVIPISAWKLKTSMQNMSGSGERA